MADLQTDTVRYRQIQIHKYDDRNNFFLSRINDEDGCGRKSVSNEEGGRKKRLKKEKNGRRKKSASAFSLMNYPI